MIHHAWTVLCARSSIDSDSNLMSLFDIIEEITVEGLISDPGVIPGPFDLVSLWTRRSLDAPEEGLARWTLLSPTNREVTHSTFAIDLSMAHRLRSRTRLAAVPIESAGLYWFRCEYKSAEGNEWAEVARLPLEIKVSASTKVSD